MLSEESKASIATRTGSTADRVWIIDPLDGTREFSEPPRDDWAVHVALWAGRRAGELVAGAVAQPGLGTTFHTGAPAGRPAAHRRAAPDRVSPHPAAGVRARRWPRRSAPSWCRWARPAPR